MGPTTTPFDGPLFLLHCECCDGRGGYVEPCSEREYYEGDGGREVLCTCCSGFGDVVVDWDPDEIEMDEVEFAP